MEDGNDRSSTRGKDKGSSAHFECRPVKGEQFGGILQNCWAMLVQDIPLFVASLHEASLSNYPFN